MTPASYVRFFSAPRHAPDPDAWRAADDPSYPDTAIATCPSCDGHGTTVYPRASRRADDSIDQRPRSVEEAEQDVQLIRRGPYLERVCSLCRGRCTTTMGEARSWVRAMVEERTS